MISNYQYNELDIQQMLDEKHAIIYQLDRGNIISSLQKIQLKVVDGSNLKISLTQSLENQSYQWSQIMCPVCTRDVKTLKDNTCNLAVFGCLHIICVECLEGLISVGDLRCPTCRREIALNLNISYLQTFYQQDSNQLQMETFNYQVKGIKKWKDAKRQQNQTCSKLNCWHSPEIFCYFCLSQLSGYCKSCVNLHEVLQRPDNESIFICQECKLVQNNIKLEMPSEIVSSVLREQILEAQKKIQQIKNVENVLLQELSQKYGGMICRVHRKGFKNKQAFKRHMIAKHAVYSYYSKLTTFLCFNCYSFTTGTFEILQNHQNFCKPLPASHKIKLIMQVLNQLQ
ncbi:hypothetical protein ABPG72_019799 [Tetrahymena utriculariae]